MAYIKPLNHQQDPLHNLKQVILKIESEQKISEDEWHKARVELGRVSNRKHGFEFKPQFPTLYKDNNCEIFLNPSREIFIQSHMKTIRIHSTYDGPRFIVSGGNIIPYPYCGTIAYQIS